MGYSMLEPRALPLGTPDTGVGVPGAVHGGCTMVVYTQGGMVGRGVHPVYTPRVGGWCTEYPPSLPPTQGGTTVRLTLPSSLPP